LPALDLRREAGLLARFGGAGVVTTVVGGTVILALDVGLHVDRRLANAIGYVVGAGLGFVLQGRFVFRGQGRREGVAWRYGAAMLFAFALNQLVLGLAAAALPQTAPGHAAAQLMAMASYTAAQFALFRLWVFRAAAA
jgi:putative flippase GtrA